MSDFWEQLNEGEIPTIDLFLTIIEISKINGRAPVKKSVILPDGHEVVLNVILNTDRATFGEELRNELV